MKKQDADCLARVCLIAALLAGCGGSNGTLPRAIAQANAVPVAGSHYSVLYSFKNGSDGAFPDAGVIFDADGAIYGTTPEGGIDQCSLLSKRFGCGTIFKLGPAGSGTYTESVLYRFCATSCRRSGAEPVAGVILVKSGVLYGTASLGGSDTAQCLTPDTQGCGTVFRIETSGRHYGVLHYFKGADGAIATGALTLRTDGALFSTTNLGGAHAYGTVYELSESASRYTENLLYSFKGKTDGPDGAFPTSGVVLGAGGGLYGTTFYGGARGRGAVFELSSSGSHYTERVIYSFCSRKACADGFQPLGTIAVSPSGGVYGTTSAGGAHGDGTVYRLTPSGSRYTETVLSSFNGRDGTDPSAGVILGKNGELYGTAANGGAYNGGTVFELTPAGSRFTEKVLHGFGAGHDGANPHASLIVGADGALYGTTESGGAHGDGIVFRLDLKEQFK